VPEDVRGCGDDAGLIPLTGYNGNGHLPGDLMNAIRIRRKINSETIHIPELRGMIGRDVEIIVRRSG
jgi:hypothetical protein